MSKRKPTSDPLESFWADLPREDKIRLYKYYKYQQTNLFSELPNEIFTIIMKNLKDYRDFISMMGVCTRFRILIQTNELTYAPDVASIEYEDIKWYVARFMFRVRLHRKMGLSPLNTIVPSTSKRYALFRKSGDLDHTIGYCKYSKIIVTKSHAPLGRLNAAQPEKCIEKGTGKSIPFKEDPKYVEELKKEIALYNQPKKVKKIN